MAKTHRVKCRYCGKGFNEPIGAFPKRLFKHMGKRHKEAVARRAAAKRARTASPSPASARRRGKASSAPPPGMYPVVPDTRDPMSHCRPICYGPCAGGPPHVHV